MRRASSVPGIVVIVPVVLGLVACSAPDPAAYPRVADLRRELAVAAVELPAAADPAAAAAAMAECGARARSEGGVYLPAGATATLLVELPRRGALRVERLRACGGPAGGLRVEVERDEGAGESTELAPATGPVAARLPRDGGIARVTLRALPAAEGRAGGLLLTGLGLGARGATPATGAPVPPVVAHSGGRPNVLVYLVDALRRDALSSYGGRDGVSPHFDRLAAEGTLFLDAWAQASWTRTAVASLFTGLTPAAHGVLGRDDALGDEAETMAELFARAGYRTGSFLTNPNVSGRVGFRQGFETQRQLLRKRRDRGVMVGAEAIAWLDATADDPRPFFAYVHTVEPHGPYLPSEPFRSRFAPGVPPEIGERDALRRLRGGLAGEELRRMRVQLRQLYDAEVAEGDAAFAELRAALEQRGLWADTIVVVVSDHGEEFFEHGRWEHGHSLHVEQLAIPLVVRVPRLGAGRRVESLAQQADVMPTLLAAAGLPPAAMTEGRSLMPLVAGSREVVPPAPVRSYHRADGVQGSAVTSRDFRLLAARFDGGGAARLYDRRRDPGERHDVQERFPIAAAYLRSVLRWPAAVQSTLARRAEGVDDPEALEQLRALGYLD